MLEKGEPQCLVTSRLSRNQLRLATSLRFGVLSAAFGFWPPAKMSMGVGLGIVGEGVIREGKASGEQASTSLAGMRTKVAHCSPKPP